MLQLLQKKGECTTVVVRVVRRSPYTWYDGRDTRCMTIVVQRCHKRKRGTKITFRGHEKRKKGVPYGRDVCAMLFSEVSGSIDF